MVFVFPGQGSQRQGMGRELFDRVPEYLAIESQVDDLLGYSLRRLCLQGPKAQLNHTRYTQPCLYTVNALYYFDALSQNKQPHFAAGHSLGEYNALLCAGVFDFFTGLKLVHKRADLMAQATQGAMAAIIALDAAQISRVLTSEGFDSIDIANYNSPSQIVISGTTTQIEAALVPLKKAGASKVVRLPVSGAFHSKMMKSAASNFGRYAAQFEFNSPTIPVIANVTGTPYPQNQPQETLVSLLTRQLYSPVKWHDSIRYLVEEGQNEFEEIGPGQGLTRLINQTRLQHLLLC
ncbi:MAG: ACP S-malonyltransferase [Algicola sp.]|nr:ACP S-malonyltransferase [Algicola sp.]